MMEGERRSSEDLNGDSLTKATPARIDESSVPVGDYVDSETRYAAMLQDTKNSEKRVPVDRRKLERLIVAGGKGNETAEEYFQRVMDTTSTVILWPSRLKIGAKSKKDPNVKIIGRPEAVSKARETLLNDLDTKSNRVTLKINVAYGEHSHVIGKEGANIKKVHTDTQCHIHFPDSNRYTQGERSDQVSITGLYPAVEIARKKVRELQPIVVTLSLPLPTHLNIDHNSSDIQTIGSTYNVTVNIKPQPQTMSMSLTVKGTMKFVEGLRLSVAKLVEYFTGDIQFAPPVMLYTDIAQQHHRTIMGREGGNLQRIMHETCTSIQMPDSHTYYRSSQVVISGPLENVIEARKKLIGCLPVALLFDVIDEDETITDSLIGDLSSKLDLFLNVKPKPKQSMKSVIVKSIEQNMECVYEARRALCDLSIKTLTTLSPETAPITQDVQLVSSPTMINDRTEWGKEELETDRTGDTQTVSIESCSNATPTSPKTVTVSSSFVPELEVTSSVATPSSPGPLKHDRTSPIGDPYQQQGGKQSPLSVSHSRLTVKAVFEYEKKKKQAEKALQSKIDPNIKRYPTDTFSGDLLSASMPLHPNPRESHQKTSVPVAKGLESLNRSGFQALMAQASIERKQAISEEQNVYEKIQDLPTLLSHLSLEKYETNFAEEEVDFETFLTMSEEDLKEVGVATLGARRKLQIAIAEIKKLKQQPEKTTPIRRGSSKLPNPSGSMIGSSSHSKSVRLTPSYMNMSRSVRF